MTYTQLRTQHCPPVDAILSGNDYVSDFDCDMRRWLTESCQKGLPPIEDRAAGQSLAGRYTVGIELCTPTSPKQPTAERGLSTRQDQHGPAHESCSIAPAAPGNEPSLPASSSEDALQACSFRARRGWSLQRDTDGTQLHVPDSPCSSRSMIPSCTEPEEVAAYCQVRNIWTILGGDLNQPGAKQATKILRRIPREVYGGAVLTALKRSADMSVEEAIEYKRARILDIMSPSSPRCQPSGQQPAQHAPSSRPVSAAPQSVMVSPDAKGAASQAEDTDSPGSQSFVGGSNSMRANLVTISAA